MENQFTLSTSTPSRSIVCLLTSSQVSAAWLRLGVRPHGADQAGPACAGQREDGEEVGVVEGDVKLAVDHGPAAATSAT